MIGRFHVAIVRRSYGLETKLGFPAHQLAFLSLGL